MKEKITKNNIYKILTVALAVVLVIALILIIKNRVVEKNAQKQYERLASQVNDLQDQMNDNRITVPSDDTADGTEAVPDSGETTQESTTSEEDTELEQKGIDIPQKNLNWQKLKSVNADIYAWLTIPGTDIDYPVLQHPTDDSYYLNYNMNGTRGYPGCIYTELANSKDFTDFDTVIYGHNMKNDMMFGELHNYGDQTFFDQNPYLYVYTADKVLVYEVFAAYQTDDTHILGGNDFSTDEGRVSYLETIVKHTQGSPKVREMVQLSVDSHLLTLSTCVNEKSDERFLVQAILLNEDQL